VPALVRGLDAPELGPDESCGVKSALRLPALAARATCASAPSEPRLLALPWPWLEAELEVVPPEDNLKGASIVPELPVLLLDDIDVFGGEPIWNIAFLGLRILSLLVSRSRSIFLSVSASLSRSPS
jgi:hypothetical protein